MNEAKAIGKLDTRDKKTISAMEEALKAKYENRKSTETPKTDNKKIISA